MSSPERRRILIIDDNADAADLLRIVLLSLGHEVRLAYGGKAGIALAQACRPDLVLCDLDMPGTNGGFDRHIVRPIGYGQLIALLDDCRGAPEARGSEQVLGAVIHAAGQRDLQGQRA